MSSNRTRIKPLVLKVLAECPAARRSNNRLVLEVWRRQHPELPAELLELADGLAQVESIRRQRARIQNEEKRFRP